MAIKSSTRLRSKNKEDTEKCDLIKLLDYGINYIKYKETKIAVRITQYHKPLSMGENGTSYHSEMEVRLTDNNNTFQENSEILNSLFRESIKYFVEEVHDTKKEKNKTTIYIWDDGYWETLEKGISRSLKTVYLDGVEVKIKEIMKTFLSEETEAEYERYGVPWKFNMLLHGYPGTGKTSLIYSLASELNMGVALLSFTRKMEDSDFMRAIRRLPERTLLVIEDIDALFESRKKNDENKNNITFTALLNSLDGIAHAHGQMIFMTTNHPLVLDSALKRPGRVDYSLKFDYANKNQIEKMFTTFLPKQIEKFKPFYKSVKHMKLTTAMLQQFLFGNKNCDNILEKLEELETLCNENKYDGNTNLYS